MNEHASGTLDRAHMARAIAIAERGRATTSPNPMVGAVVVDADGVIVGAGTHEVAGGPHAEVHALADAGTRARGATLYCTLEPCSHTGRTGPCAPRVVGAGIRRAVIAVEDPNPLVSGRGLAYLRAHGVEVTVGVLGEVAERQNAPFFTVMREGRPFVTMKVALSSDRRVGRRGERTALTGGAANRLVHRERAEVDAIGVGSGTVLTDDPLLTARGAYRARPLVRVIFDRRLSTPPSARVFSTHAHGPIIVATATVADDAGRRRLDALRLAGATVEEADPDPDGGSFLRVVLARRAAQGVLSLVLEGGPTLHRAAWAAGLIDRVQVFTTLRTLGADGVPWLDEDMLRLEALADLRHVVLGEDRMIEGYVHRAR